MDETITAALVAARREAGVSQRVIASALGVTPQYLSDIENGRRTLPEKYLERLPDAIRAPVVRAAIADHEAAIRRLRPLAQPSPRQPARAR